MSHLFFAAMIAMPSSTLASKGEIVLRGMPGSSGDMPVSAVRVLVLGGVMVLELAKRSKLASSRNMFMVKRMMAAVGVSRLEEMGENKLGKG
jgi:hypothetical protein